jgi:arylformamidase
MRKIYDISRTISEETPAWPGDVAFSWRETARVGAGAGAPWGSTCFTMSAHCGTHADAPSHLFEDGKAIAEAPLAAYVGPARVLQLPGVGEVGPDALPRRCLGPSRVLFRSFAKASLSPLAAIRLADAGVMLVGTDGASIDPEDAEDLPAHRALLSRGIALLEDLDLSAVPDGDYELVALPLRFRDLDASPVRAILIKT